MALDFKKEEGYTLVETLTAMAIFVAVLLPLLGTVSDLMLDRSSERKLAALRIAEAEMVEVSLQKEPRDREQNVEGYRLVREVAEVGRLWEVRISVLDKEKKPLVVLHRTFLKEP